MWAYSVPGISQILSLILERSYKSEIIFILHPAMKWWNWCANLPGHSAFQASPSPAARCPPEQAGRPHQPSHSVPKATSPVLHTETLRNSSFRKKEEKSHLDIYQNTIFFACHTPQVIYYLISSKAKEGFWFSKANLLDSRISVMRLPSDNKFEFCSHHIDKYFPMCFLILQS